MNSQAKLWWNQAKADLDTAEYNFNGAKYEAASFFAQQAAEKALKAMLLGRGLELIKTHDLVFLAKRLKLPEMLVSLCQDLSPVYVETRYPAVNGGFRKFGRKESEEDLKIVREILSWIGQDL